jgi:hypothetical protein
VSNARNKQQTKKNKMVLNYTQQQIMQVTLNQFLLEDDDYLNLEPSKAILVLSSILEINEDKYLENSELLEETNTITNVEFIRSILNHESPQNVATTHYEAPDGYVRYRNYHSESIVYEKQGLLGLTARNDNSAEPVTKSDVTKFITDEVQRELSVQNRMIKQQKTLMSQQLQNHHRQQQKKNQVDVSFIVDCTYSMDEWIKYLKNDIDPIIQTIHNKFPSFTVKISFVGYRDYDETPQYEVLKFTQNTKVFSKFLDSISAVGGGDVAEDIFTGLDQCSKLDWSGDLRIAMLIADAPCHGREFHDMGHGADSYYLKPHKYGFTTEKLFNELKMKQVLKFYMLRIFPSTQKMERKFKKIFDDPSVGSELIVQKLSTPDKMNTIIIESISESIDAFMKK